MIQREKRRQQTKAFKTWQLSFELLAVITCIIMVLMLLAVTINTYTEFYRFSKYSAEQYAVEVSRSYAISISSDFKEMLDAAADTRSNLEVILSDAENGDVFFSRMQRHVMNNHSILHSIRILYERNGTYRTLYINRDGDGKIHESEDTLDFTSSLRYQKDKEISGPQLTPVRIDNGQNVISLVLPIWDEQLEFSGLIYVNVLQSYFQALNTSIRPLGCETFIVDSQFQMIAEVYQPNPGADVPIKIARNSELGEAIAKNIDDGEAVHKYMRNPFSNEDCLMVFYPVDMLNGEYGSFCTIVPQAQVYQSLYATRNAIGINLFLLVMVVAVFAFYGNIIHKRMYLDPLTSINNRRFLDRHLPVVLNNCAYKNVPVAIIICDIDHFKRVNDAYGHQTGDAVLKYFCKILRLQMRKQDWLARYGGEEFLICLPNTGLENAKKVAERVRRTVENNVYNGPGASGVKITASFGVACSTAEKPMGMVELIRATDGNLYHAKASGRNIVVG